jgi:hypothetical protein
MNVVGGYLVTDRMLQMFRPRRAPAASATADSGATQGSSASGETPGERPAPSAPKG